MKPNRNAFNEWIEAEGLEALATRLKISQNTISNWQTGFSNPRVNQMRAIKRLTKGRIGYEEIIDRKFLPKSVRAREK